MSIRCFTCSGKTSTMNLMFNILFTQLQFKIVNCYLGQNDFSQPPNIDRIAEMFFSFLFNFNNYCCLYIVAVRTTKTES